MCSWLVFAALLTSVAAFPRLNQLEKGSGTQDAELGQDFAQSRLSELIGRLEASVSRATNEEVIVIFTDMPDAMKEYAVSTVKAAVAAFNSGIFTLREAAQLVSLRFRSKYGSHWVTTVGAGESDNWISSLESAKLGNKMEPDNAGDAANEEPLNGAVGFFDVTLPTKHAYLGDLREIYNRPYYAEGSLITLPFVYVPDIVLMPNQHMPINVDPHDIDLNPLLNDLVDVEHQRKGFVCMAADVGYDLSPVKELHPYFLFGTVASVVRIENQGADHDQVDAGNGTRMIVRGCQRCLLKDFIPQPNPAFQRRLGLFRILPDAGLDPPLQNLLPPEWRIPLKAAGKSNRLAAFLTPYCPAVYATVDIDTLVTEIMREITTLQLRPENTTDPTEFSYWLSTTLPLPAHFRLQLLGACSTVHRLRSCLMMLRTFNRLNCAVCGVGLAVKQDGICMSRGDLTVAYINPSGLTQEIFTVSKVSNISVFGVATAEYTWFPGYAWRHLRCRGCHGHLGWRYDAVSAGLLPRHFYGLRRGDVVPSIQPDEGLSPQELQDFYQEHTCAMTPVYYREK